MNRALLSVVIPALNEAARIVACLERVRTVLPEADIVVADGGSADETPAVAVRGGARVVSAARGRGTQCHAGALGSQSEWLLFLHADTLLPPASSAIVGTFVARPEHQVATFRVRFSDGGRLLNAFSWVMTRGDSVFTRFGDQGILIRRALYDALGGFPPWPLFEDVELLRRARRVTRIYWLAGAVETSARRFNRSGLLRQRLLNAQLMVRYLAGASPADLAARYNRAASLERRAASLSRG